MKGVINHSFINTIYLLVVLLLILISVFFLNIIWTKDFRVYSKLQGS